MRGLIRKVIKSALTTFLSLVFMPKAYADIAQLKLNISGGDKQHPYFLCIYGVGCLNIHKGFQGKAFPMGAKDMGNILKFVITNAQNMRMYFQNSHPSCSVMVSDNQTLTISGRLSYTASSAHIEGLRCRVE